VKEKCLFFRRKYTKIAENCDVNIDPQCIFSSLENKKKKSAVNRVSVTHGKVEFTTTTPALW
jgi:hypothetical protein